MRRRLRLFIGEDELDNPELQPPEVALELGELTDILQNAVAWDRAWLQDFSDERVKISADLYEVLMAYSRMRPSA